jgi:photosystem II stability/assembly factor-like uncharacterized protein
MKKNFAILIIIHFSLIIANAQWIQQNSGTTVDFSCVRFIDINTGWICGNGGVILKTTNSGINWFFCNNGIPNKPYSRIFPVDSNIVYCVGYFNTIIKSTNGGNNWQIISDGPFGQGDSYQACFFLNANTGWIAGPDYKMIKTTNGGIFFDSIQLPTGGFNHDIFFRNSMEGLYCGEIGKIRKSTNGGLNWFSIKIPIGFNGYYFRNFSFINNLTGWLVCDSRNIFKTTDFGDNWDSLSYVPNGSYGIHYIKFTSANTGYSCGEGFNVFKSTNGGVNWVAQNGNGGHYLSFLNDTVGWKIANLGYIHHTTNGGENSSSITGFTQISNNFKLFQNYPNPFNPTTNIQYDLPKNVFVSIKIYDLLGREIKTLVNEYKNAGSYIVSFNGSELASGVYFYRIQAGSFVQVKKMLMIK